MSEYDPGFYRGQADGSLRSAAAIVPSILKLVNPASMIDIGCGVGHWSAQFRNAGVTVAHGIDGPWARDLAEQFAQSEFVEFDFNNAALPFKVATPLPRYDLVTSFEFFEHIDPDRADALVDLVCSLSDVAVIGAAIPFQGGRHHVNEQWPDYWAKKFAQRGYIACDFIRPMVWNLDVDPWYAQNPIAYFRGAVPEAALDLARTQWAAFASHPRPFVHPKLWSTRPATLRAKVRAAAQILLT